MGILIQVLSKMEPSMARGHTSGRTEVLTRVTFSGEGGRVEVFGRESMGIFLMVSMLEI